MHANDPKQTLAVLQDVLSSPPLSLLVLLPSFIASFLISLLLVSSLRLLLSLSVMVLVFPFHSPFPLGFTLILISALSLLFPLISPLFVTHVVVLMNALVRRRLMCQTSIPITP